MLTQVSAPPPARRSVVPPEHRHRDAAAPMAPAIPTARPAQRRFRLVRAYGAALRIALSYLAFHIATLVLGRAWAARHRDALHTRNGRRLRRAILRLRGLFVKAGQLASVLTT
ncbi:MAG TPA: hypothetical protein VGB53_15525, partial [Rubricoccaceae bacterium]